jgi:glycosyltransferase involved in cell wall biosynthesis
MKKLDIVIPLFNEELIIEELLKRLDVVRKKFRNTLNVNYVFINDGSSDNSLFLLKKKSKDRKFLKIISFSRNFGHQLSVSAGIDHSKADFIAIIDADLQDPPEKIYEMYHLMQKNNVEVVYGKRRKRSGESFFKKFTANLFYNFLSKMCDIEIPVDTGDFRLITKKVADNLKKMPEKHRFLRGMVPWIGFKSLPLVFDRDERYAGETKYPLKKMIEFAINAILSFSSKPLMLLMNFGLGVVFISLIISIVLIVMRLFNYFFVPGFVAILLAVIFFGGVNIFLIGMIGQYVSRIFEEVKLRPLYIIDETINFK